MYGFAVIVVVIYVLPETEYAAFALFQSVFLIICVLSDSIFLQPMVKFASEHEAEVEQVLAASFNLYTVVMLVCGIGFALASAPIADLYHSPALGTMLLWLPAALILNIFRGIGIRLLQVSYRIKQIFWIDLAYYGSIIFLTVLFHSLGSFKTGMDFLKFNIIGGVISSTVAIYYGWASFRAMPLLHVPRGEYGKLLTFAKFQAGTSILQTLQQWADVLIVGIYTPPSISLYQVALYSAAKTLYRVFDAVREGATLLIVPVASRMHTAGEKDKLSELVEKMLFVAFAVMVPVSLVLALGAEPLMKLFKYHDKFPGIEPVFEVLILSGFILPLVLVSTNVLIGIGRVKGLFFAMLVATLVFFVLNRLLVPDMHSVGAALAVLISTGIMGILTFIDMRRELSISARGVARSIKNLKSS